MAEEHFVVRLDRGYSEKRDFIRMAAETQIIYSVEGENQRYTGTTKNFNFQGVMFEGNVHTEPGTILNISINSLNGRVNHLTGVATVKRADKAPNGKGYQIACQINELK